MRFRRFRVQVPGTVSHLIGVLEELDLTRLPVTQEITGSNPVHPAMNILPE